MTDKPVLIIQVSSAGYDGGNFANISLNNN